MITDKKVIDTIDRLLEENIGRVQDEAERRRLEKIRAQKKYEDFLRLLPVRERMRILNMESDKKLQQKLQQEALNWINKSDFSASNTYGVDFSNMKFPQFKINSVINMVKRD